MASVDPWVDFESVRLGIRRNTVDKLKHLVNGVNEECRISLSKSGRKQDLIDRLHSSLDGWKLRGEVDKWNKAKEVIQQVQTLGVYSSGNMPRVSYPLPITALASQTTGANVKPYGSVNAAAGSSTIGRYDPYAPPRRPATASSAAPSTSSGPPTIRFKPSPFIRVERSVSSVVECPESSSATDRRQQTVTFTLNPDHIAKLTSPGSKYQLRLFCTSSVFHSPGVNSFRTAMGPCPIEFPPTCEIRVNNVQITANTKGLKKKPGTAPPADLGKTIRMTAHSQNRIELIYVNSQQPVQPKKFYMVVNLVEITGVDELVDKVKKGKYKSTADVLAKMATSVSDDDDIVAGPQKMSLKCPLSYMRITTPCRSVMCVHSQCFDAMSWFSVMEQTTTYLCPVCEHVLNYEELIIDGYFDDILKQSPESVEDVIVEADGEWHTSDNKYGSTRWRSTHPPILPRAPSLPPPPKPDSTDQNGKKKAVEIMVLDSDDEDDEGRVKRELSPSFASGSSSIVNQAAPTSQSQGDDVIDLTLDSEDEETPPPPSKTAEKRKAPDYGLPSPTEQQHLKRSRLDILPLVIPRNINGHVNGTAGSTHMNGTISPSALTVNNMHMQHYDPVRDAHRGHHSNNYVPPRLPAVPGPPAVRYPGDTTYRQFPGPNSPPPPPPRHTSGSSGRSTPRGRDYSYPPPGTGYRWP